MQPKPIAPLPGGSQRSPSGEPADAAEPFSQAEQRRLGKALVRWFDKNRRALPWRRGYRPYQVWISEMMLQQTQVATVLPYYDRWMARFSSVAQVAGAPLQEVLKAWEGLGYYSRARALHRAAQEMVARFGGEVPSSVAALRTLPGVGPYTAAAIAAIAFERPVVALDGNGLRVLSRIFAQPGFAKTPGERALLARLGGELLPPGAARDFNQGLMELGALVCRAGEARCGQCPAQPQCRAARTGRPLGFPAKTPRPIRPLVAGAMVLLSRRGRVLVRQRPPGGLWGGLWEFPWQENGAGASGQETAAGLAEQLGAGAGPLKEVGTVRHGLTHFRLELACFAGVAPPGAAPPTPAGGRWLTPAGLGAIPLGKPNHKALALWLEKPLGVGEPPRPPQKRDK